MPDSEAHGTCVANIGSKERRKRKAFGIVLLVASAILGALLVGLGAHRLWRLALFLPIWVGALGVFQATDKTCVALASRGQRDMDSGPEAISDAAQLSQIRRQVRFVHVKSLLLATVLLALMLMIPE